MARLRDGIPAIYHQTWQPGPIDTLTAPVAIFDGLQWQSSHAPEYAPHLAWHPADQGPEPLRLNARGRLPFDDIRSVTSRNGELFVTHGAGVTVHRATPDGLLPIRTAQEPETEPQPADWNGPLAGTRVELTRTAPNHVTLRRAGEGPYSLRYPNRVLALTALDDALWVLTPHTLYRTAAHWVPHPPPPATSPPPAPHVEPLRVEPRPVDALVVTVRFASASAHLDPQAQQQLASAAARLTHHQPTHRIWIDGHADRHGPPAVNLDLSRRRAQAVSRALTRLGVAPNRFDLRFFGNTRPLPGADPGQNRRVEIRLQPSGEISPTPRASQLETPPTRQGAPLESP